MSIFNIFKRKIKEKKVINKVILYVLSYDLISKELKNILDVNKIAYELIEVDNDSELSNELTKKGMDTYPILDVDGEIIQGMNVKKISKALDIKIKSKMSLKERIGYSQLK